jgi:hypothetical protein
MWLLFRRSAGALSSRKYPFTFLFSRPALESIADTSLVAGMESAIFPTTASGPDKFPCGPDFRENNLSPRPTAPSWAPISCGPRSQGPTAPVLRSGENKWLRNSWRWATRSRPKTSCVCINALAPAKNADIPGRTHSLPLQLWERLYFFFGPGGGLGRSESLSLSDQSGFQWLFSFWVTLVSLPPSVMAQSCATPLFCPAAVNS